MQCKKNVLMIMTDQHRADCLGCMGNSVIQTPNLDRISAEGITFENAFCQSPVCMASRASLFTGRYPESVRVRGMGVLPPAETTLPEVLLRHGYRTAAFGKVHFTPELYTRNILHEENPVLDWKRFAADACLSPVPDDPCKKNYGFATHVGCEDVLQGNFIKWLKERTSASFRPEETGHIAENAPADLFVSPYPSELHQSSFITEQTADYIKAAKKEEKPWFALCSFIAPHHPFEAPADQIRRYDIASIPLPSAKGGVDPALIPHPAADAIGEMDRYPPEIRKKILLHYFASISLVDDCVGKLLEALAQTGQMEETILVFVSDHGEFLGNHGLLRKPSIHYDELIRVPLLLRIPGTPRNGDKRRIRGLVELTDIHPTLLGLLGIPINNGVQGTDWSSNITSGNHVGKEDIYSDMFDLTPQRFGKAVGPYMAVRTLRTEHWKLNLYPTAGPQYGQLFDLKNDSDESRNLYCNPNFRERREELFWRLVSRMHKNTDPLPLVLTQF